MNSTADAAQEAAAAEGATCASTGTVLGEGVGWGVVAGALSLCAAADCSSPS
eukprot:COSAG04_NODE_5086_length_1743_cov_1.909976_1_plen_52_part_00